MASKQPVHGGSAQTKEFDVDLVAEGIRSSRGYRGPYYALAVVSVDANGSLRIEIEAANQYDWQLDARIIGGSLDISRIFCEGDSVHGADVPDWVERVAGVVGERLEGDR
ncbi:hypothetical protein C461_04637 [Halorubrum aidingense JCM 13560]|uniref:Uncharacterized protein n=1 Tax=Halorubrum aidingense JCM 13560 TaxID=1230454 RepID=M0PG50_9EURY|nr:hypothetical protein [Halorubrum aidingense]EMA68888.1 hypothetical protein C461_04637 [Halorubrum aidingense JCM 13560]